MRLVWLLWIASEMITAYAENPVRTKEVGSYRLEFFENGQSYDAANTTCESRDAWLVEIKDKDIEDAVLEFILHYDIWIGVSRNVDGKWNDGTDMLYNNWTTSTQLPRTSLKCARMSRAGAWDYYSDCGNAKRYVCQSDISYPGSFSIRPVTFPTLGRSSAATTCATSGSRLVEIKTSALNTFVMSKLSDDEMISYWTSANDATHEDNFQWGDGTPIEKSNPHWLQGEPDGGNTNTQKDCLAISSRDGAWGWTDENCHSERGYICQKNITTGPCGDDICSHRGTCEILGKRYVCKCNAGYFGTKCEQDYCHLSPCANSGICSYGTTTPYYACTCTPEYNGPQCQNENFVTNGNCKYHVNQKTRVFFTTANSTCSNLGGSLAMLKPLSVQNTIESQIIAQYGDDNSAKIAFWVGGYKFNDEWLWIDGSKIPRPGSDHRWKGWGNDYMLISSYGTTRDKMHWYSKLKSGAEKFGYVCEVAVINPCNQIPCKNEGTCIATGCQGKCRCKAGYNGDLCETDRITITPMETKYTVTVGKTAEIEFSLSSNQGSVRIDVFNGAKHVKYVTKDPGTISIPIGPLQTQTEGDRYTFRATPKSALWSYYRLAYVTIIVEGPSSLKISTNVLAIPSIVNRDVKCEATGVPKPALTWKYGGVEVTTLSSAAVYQFPHLDYRYIKFKKSARTEVGNYTCYATKTIDGEIKETNITLFVRGQLKLINKTEQQTESASGSSTFSCTYEGYPAGNIDWKWGKVERDLSKIDANKSGSIFEVQSQGEKKSTLYQTTSTLTVKLPEYLGRSNVACYAGNEYENSADNTFSLNRNLVLLLNKSCQVYNGDIKRNFTDAQTVCQNNHRTLIRIVDNETQKMLSTELEKRGIKENVFIGAQKHTQGNVSIWKWSNGNFLYNETKSYRSTKSGGVIIDGSYVAWADGEPKDTGNDCAVMDHQKQWFWSDATCADTLAFICESSAAGIPQDFLVTVEKCTSDITVNWTAGAEAVGVKHSIKVKELASSPECLEKVPFDETQISQHFPNLKQDTKYNVTISVCPECPRPYTLTKSVSTYATVPADNLRVTEANVTREGHSCVLRWKLFNSTGVAGFNITAHSVIAHPASNRYTKKPSDDTFTTPREKSDHGIVQIPNRIYSFSIRVETCLGQGPTTAVHGDCISDTASPTTVPTSIIATDPNGDGTMTIEIVIPDESYGPLSCIFVIVVYKPSNSSKQEYDSEKLQNAMSKTQGNSLSANDAYVALAIKRSDIGERESLTRILGDGSPSQCDVTKEATSKRRKRSISNTTIKGNNRKLEDDASYSFFTVTATPLEDGKVAYATSGTSTFVKPAPNSDGGMIAGIIVALLFTIALVAVGTFFILKKRKLLNQKDTGTMRMEQLEENDDALYANFAMDNRGPRSETDIKLENLQATYNSLIAKENANFQTQFLALKEEAKNLEYATKFSSNITLKRKNRYKNILPPDSSRVVLGGEGDASYINACYIHGYSSPKKFIATQGPLPETLNDFWRMIVEQKCTVIAMLTRVAENTKVKCEKYWPDLDSTQTFGDITVENTKEESFGSYKLRILLVTYEGQAITVNHFHFLYWPDHGVPFTTTNLVRYHEAVTKLRANTPIIVHCSAGAGRTGAFIAYDFLCEEAESLSSVDVYRCVMTLREQRVDMVQNYEQYILVHKLLLEKYLFGKTETGSDEITRSLPSETSLQKEFENLSVVAPINHAKFGDQQKYRALNRNQNIIPYGRNRVTVAMRDTEDEVPYINASIVETYEPSTKLIAAQGPVKASVEHFWRAVFDNHVNTIVMLTKCVESKKEQSARYWPDEQEGSIALNDMKVVFRSLNSSGQLITRDFQVTRHDEEKIITQYQYIGWDSDGTPENVSDILDLVENMHAHVRNMGGGIALVHCSDGAGRTGVFCAIANMLQRLKCEKKVDVFRTVKDLRDYRPGMVHTLEQYRFCYEAVSSYLTSYHLYSNFAVEKQEQGEEENIYQNM